MLILKHFEIYSTLNLLRGGKMFPNFKAITKKCAERHQQLGCYIWYVILFMNTHIQWRVGWERGPAMNNERAQPEGITEMQRCKLFVPPWLMTCSHSRLYPSKQLVCECVFVWNVTENLPPIIGIYCSKQIFVKTFLYLQPKQQTLWWNYFGIFFYILPNVFDRMKMQVKIEKKKQMGTSKINTKFCDLLANKCCVFSN
jgi:hypothetical protein